MQLLLQLAIPGQKIPMIGSEPGRAELFPVAQMSPGEMKIFISIKNQ
jgi:hypothetical protein